MEAVNRVCDDDHFDLANPYSSSLMVNTCSSCRPPGTEYDAHREMRRCRLGERLVLQPRDSDSEDDLPLERKRKTYL